MDGKDERAMPNLIIGNVNNENMVGEMWRMTYEKKCLSSVVANRLTWLLRDGDMILLPYPPSEAFLQYAFNLTSVDANSVTVIVPANGEWETELLTLDVLSNPKLVEQLRKRIDDPQDWTATPYYFDRAAAWLINQLKIQAHPGLLEYNRQGGAEQLNSKAEFRRIATGHDIPIPEGVVCSSLQELQLSLQELIAITGAVIIKQDLSAGGKGNIVVTSTREKVSAGAIETILIETAQQMTSVAEQLWSQLTGPRNVSLVVEVYHPCADAYYSELEILAGSRRPYLLNFGEMRMDPIWVGFEIPSSKLAPYQLGEFLSLSMKLADIARSRGYIGKISCDAMRTQEGQILFNEVNGRLGGCTHIHVLASYLFGRHYGDNYTLLTRNRVKAGQFQRVLHLLDNEGLLYTSERGQGVVILSEDTHRTGTIEYMLAASEKIEAYEMEQRTLAILERSVVK